MQKKGARAKACDISPKTKEIVWQRDGGRCVVCGANYPVAPNAHYISRAHGGLGVPENIVTLCWKCHHDFDNGPSKARRVEIGETIENYLRHRYPDWDKEKLIFKKD